ncbi:TonB-dependent receptor [Pedobacter frigoris]|uniref:TonB-dependent receptor n=1 Tax=Pedobacter frigoris TaxID=2571272 RepID=A0A4V5NZW4_9SPHI|nr:TonB-dependent receptor [Pedobacter frigoris]TKC08622.1 TonB-dependent receptor [Pedobacter frigoris]
MKFISILLFCLFVCGKLNAQLYPLAGLVLDTEGAGLKGALVSISGCENTLYTDKEGRFFVDGLKRGNHQVMVSLGGYYAQKLLVNIQNRQTSIKVVMKTSDQQLKEVVVKHSLIAARRQEESLNIEVVGSEFIQRNLGGSLMKSLERLPGIKTIGIGSGQSKPLIRGLGFNRVLVVDKGVKHEGQQWGADHGLEIDQFAAAEVELVKGAASFIYGSDAIGGVIEVKPASAPQKNTLGGSIDLIGKSNNNLYGTSVNLFGRREHWFLDTRVTYQNYGDYSVPTDTVFVYDYAVRLHNRQLRNTAGRETGLHLATGYVKENFRSVFYFSNVYNKSGFFANAHGLEPRRVNTEMHDASARDIQMPSQQVNHFKVVNRSDYRMGVHKLEMELGYQQNFRQEFSQYVNHGYMPPVYPDGLSVSPELEREFDKQVYSINLKDMITLGNHQFTAGFNSEYQDNTINGWTFLVPSFKQVTAGIFVYDKYKIGERVLLHGALRYDRGQIRMFKYTDWFNSELTTDGTTIAEKLIRANDLKRSFNSLVWSVGLNYNHEQFLLKANAGKSFRMPIAKELGANGVNYHYFSYEKGDPTLAPEQSYQLDLSLGWNEARWSVLISPFYNYFPNYIYLNPTANHDFYYGAGNQIFQYAQSEVIRYGGELQLKYRIWKSLSAEFLGEYLFAQQISGDKKGYTLPFSPPASALFNLSWSPAPESALRHSYFSVDYRLTTRQDNIVPPEKKTPGYGLINLQAGTKLNISGQQLALSFQVQNLLDTRYLNHTSFYRLIELPEQGRNIVLSLKMPFNISLKQTE